MSGLAFNGRGREPFGPLIVRSRRGVMHRAQPGPVLHARCAGGRPFVGDVLTPTAATTWATGRTWSLCRYPWCFRETLEAAGIDPTVGHVRRNVSSNPRTDVHPRIVPARVMDGTFEERRARAVRERAEQTWTARHSDQVS